MSLDLLGAKGLGSKYVTLRIQQIDGDKLRRKLGGVIGEAVSAALPLAAWQPELALRTALPPLVNKVKDDYGVDLEYTVSGVPPPKGATQRSFGSGLFAGLALAGAGWALWHFGLSRWTTT